jgi:hypothetical protein
MTSVVAPELNVTDDAEAFVARTALFVDVFVAVHT